MQHSLSVAYHIRFLPSYILYAMAALASLSLSHLSSAATAQAAWRKRANAWRVGMRGGSRRKRAAASGDAFFPTYICLLSYIALCHSLIYA